MLVRWTPEAAADLQTIVAYIRRDSPKSARNVAKKLFDAASCLDRFPRLGRVGFEVGTRELTFPGLPYILVYEIRDEAVWLLRFHHGAQDWP